MKTIVKNIAQSKAPARPDLRALLVATLFATTALTALVALGSLSGHVLLLPPLVASMALITAVPSLPLAQPRNVIGGQAISAILGVMVGLVSHSLWAVAIAGGLSFGMMLLTRTSHSPAAATAALGVTLPEGQVSFVVCTVLAAVVLVVFGVIRSSFKRTPYPAYWW